MSKIVNRIFKNKNKTVDDIQYSSPTKADAKNGTMPRSKTVQLNVANGQSKYNGTYVDGGSPGADSWSSKNLSVKRSLPPRSASPASGCLSPMEIPVEEALQLIAEEPPHVARSTPKGLVVDTSRWKEEHDMQHCIYERAVYEKMIDNSLKTCELLQTHLDSYITVVRQTLSQQASPVKSGVKPSNEERKEA